MARIVFKLSNLQAARAAEKAADVKARVAPSYASMESTAWVGNVVGYIQKPQRFFLVTFDQEEKTLMIEGSVAQMRKSEAVEVVANIFGYYKVEDADAKNWMEAEGWLDPESTATEWWKLP